MSVVSKMAPFQLVDAKSLKPVVAPYLLKYLLSR